jgi:hypothetical protein
MTTEMHETPKLVKWMKRKLSSSRKDLESPNLNYETLLRQDADDVR